MIPQRIEQVLAPELVEDDNPKREGSRRRLFSLTNRSPSPTSALSPASRTPSPFPHRAPSPFACPSDLITHTYGSSTPTYSHSWCGEDIEFKVSLEWKDVAPPQPGHTEEEYQPWTMEKFVEVMLKSNGKAAEPEGESSRHIQWIMFSSFLLSKAECPPQKPNIPSLRDLDAMKRGHRTSSTAYSLLHSKKLRNANKGAMASWLPNTEEAVSARRNLTANFIAAEPGSKDTQKPQNAKKPTVKAKYTDAFTRLHGSSNGHGRPKDQAGRLHHSLDVNAVPKPAPPSPSTFRPAPSPSTSRPPPSPATSRPPLAPRNVESRNVESSPVSLKVAPMTATIEIASGEEGLLQAVADARRPRFDSGQRGIPAPRGAKSPIHKPKSPEAQASFIPENHPIIVAELQE